MNTQISHDQAFLRRRNTVSRSVALFTVLCCISTVSICRADSVINTSSGTYKLTDPNALMNATAVRSAQQTAGLAIASAAADAKQAASAVDSAQTDINQHNGKVRQFQQDIDQHNNVLTSYNEKLDSFNNEA